jgi:biopolymer transport protein ExbD
MAFSGMSSNGARGRGRWRGGGSLSEMNVVPLVDVVLVLLVIFMVTASAMEFGLEIEVPTVKTVSKTLSDGPVVQISNKGTLYLADKPTNINVLAEEIKRQYPDAKDVIVRADKNNKVELYVQVLAAVGETKLAVKLVSKAEDIRK